MGKGITVGDLISPWVPMSNPLDVKHLGKLMEELGEAQAAVARCLIQGIDEREPVTGRLNRDWLQDELSDVQANIDLVADRFKLNWGYIAERILKKKRNLRLWHTMGIEPDDA